MWIHLIFIQSILSLRCICIILLLKLLIRDRVSTSNVIHQTYRLAITGILVLYDDIQVESLNLYLSNLIIY